MPETDGHKAMADSASQQEHLECEIERLERVADRSATVLVCDDMQTMRLLLVQAMRKAGFDKVERAPDGDLALRILKASGCDLALVDWKMPRMNGMELLEKVRADRELSGIVFIMVTAETMDRRVIQAAEEHQDAYLTKPISPEKLTRRLNLVLEKRLTMARSSLLELRGQADQAVEVLVKAIQNRPGLHWPLFGLGRLLARLERWGEAEQCFQRVIDQDPGALSALVELGGIREMQGDLRGGQRLYKKAMSDNPMFFRAYDVMARSLHQSGDPRRAMDVLQRAVEQRGSENAARQELMGKLSYQLEQYPEAEAALAKSLELKPERNLVDNNLALARSRIAQGLYYEAILPLTKAAKGGPEENQLTGRLDAMLLLGAVHIHSGDLEAADREFDKMKDPDRWPGGELPFEEHHLEREVGGVYLMAGREDQARERFAKSLSLAPQDQDNLEIMEAICRVAGREELVEQELAAQEERKESQVEAHSRRGLALVAQGRFEEALAEYCRGLAIDPQAGRLHFNLGKLQHRLQMTDQAKESMTRSARQGLARQDWELVAEVARFLEGRGLRTQALALLQKVQDMAPGHPALRQVLVEIKNAS